MTDWQPIETAPKDGSRVLLWYLFVGGSLMVALIAATPTWLGDSNSFLKNFVNHEYINTLGVILAITLASLSQIHLSLNRIEEKRQKIFLDSARSEIKSNATWLLVLFVIGVLLVVAKPIVGGPNRASGFFNGCCILILGLNVMIFWDVTRSVFTIKPELDDKNAEDTKESDNVGPTAVKKVGSKNV